MFAILIVLDSVGIGEAPDAALYGDVGSNTLGNLALAQGGLNLPTFQKLGLGNIPAVISPGSSLAGVPPATTPMASYGAMQELSQGKDTTTGHWEMAGIHLRHGFTIFPPQAPSFPPELTTEFSQRTGRNIIGNKAASGTAIIEELGPQHIKDGSWIIYTSADSVMQIAAHLDVIPLEELYSACKTARLLCNRHRVGRVIARPFTGQPGTFTRTEDRRDFSFPLPAKTVMENLIESNIPVVTIGKIDDIFDRHGITRAFHTENSHDAQKTILDIAKRKPRGLAFVNLIDFDMLYGHRRDTAGYASALEKTDAFLAELLPLLHDDTILMITADHGNDPTFKGTDHTRELVPLLYYRPGAPPRDLGIRHGFFDIAQTIADFFGILPMKNGTSFLHARPKPNV